MWVWLMWTKLSCADCSPAPVKEVSCHQTQKGCKLRGALLGLQCSPTFHSKSTADLPSLSTQNKIGPWLDWLNVAGKTKLLNENHITARYVLNECSVYPPYMSVHIVPVCDSLEILQSSTHRTDRCEDEREACSAVGPSQEPCSNLDNVKPPRQHGPAPHMKKARIGRKEWKVGGGGGRGKAKRSNSQSPQVPACTVASLQMFTLDQTGGQLVAIDPLPGRVREWTWDVSLWERGGGKPHTFTHTHTNAYQQMKHCLMNNLFSRGQCWAHPSMNSTYRC